MRPWFARDKSPAERTSLTAPIAPGESIIAPRTDSSASRFCGGTGAVGEVLSGCEASASWYICDKSTTSGHGRTGLDKHALHRRETARLRADRNACSHTDRTERWKKRPLVAAFSYTFPQPSTE